MSVANKLLQAAAGNAGEAVYVDDLFSTYLYKGNGSATRHITNGIDISGEGGLIWIKNRDQTDDHVLVDTERGVKKIMKTNTTTASTSDTNTVKTFNSDGFTISNDNKVNSINEYFCSWTFRKQEKFFDMVTYTGDGVAGRTVSHNLGVKPGMIIIKCTSNAGKNWVVYHRSLGATKYVRLNIVNGEASSSTYFNDTEPTSDEFTLGTNTHTNGSGLNYIAYLFAHDEQDFGKNSDEAIIHCGSYTTVSEEAEIDLGFEPQFVMFKRTDASTGGDWNIFDTMRGLTGVFTGGGAALLEANTSDAETDTDRIAVTPTGFKVDNYGASRDYIYVAIARPHKPASEFAATELHKTVLGASGTSNPAFVAGFPVDMAWKRNATSTYSMRVHDRLRGPKELYANSTGAEGNENNAVFDFMDGFFSSGVTHHSWMWRRAKGYFDIVAYSGDNTTNQQVSHNLGVAPELMILKPINSVGAWAVYSAPTTEAGFLMLHNTAAYQTGSYWGTSGGTAPTATTITVDGSGNNSGTDYILYLFASVAGISKVGSYTGSGSTQTIDCGFSNGARFVLIKKTSGSANWFFWDSVRGITSGLDNYLIVNSSAAQTTNSPVDVNPASSGFEVFGNDSDSNRSGETYLFYAIA